MVALDDALGDFQPADAGHVQVAQDDVRLQLADLREGRFAAVGLADDLDIRLIRQDQLHARTDKSVIIDQKNPDGHLV